MKQKRSMDEALNAAKQMRRELSAEQEVPPASDARLTVVETATPELPSKGPSVAAKTTQEDQPKPTPSPSNPLPLRPVWVRHTVGLKDATSLGLRDAAEAQKRKARHGQLQVGEPANEQEIADLGISLALEKIGFAS